VNGMVAEASGHVSGPSSHAGNAEAPPPDAGKLSTAPDATDYIDYFCSLDQINEAAPAEAPPAFSPSEAGEDGDAPTEPIIIPDSDDEPDIQS
jgi:hypothetical protein